MVATSRSIADRTAPSTSIPGGAALPFSAPSVCRDLRPTFHQDVLGLTGLRALVLLLQDESALSVWSKAVVDSPNGTFCFVCPAASDSQAASDVLANLDYSWRVLLLLVAIPLLQSVANDPQ